MSLEKELTKDERIDKARDLLEDGLAMLRGAVGLLRQASRIIRPVDKSMAGRLDSYPIGHIEAFIEQGGGQVGNLYSELESLDELEGNEP